MKEESSNDVSRKRKAKEEDGDDGEGKRRAAVLPDDDEAKNLLRPDPPVPFRSFTQEEQAAAIDLCFFIRSTPWRNNPSQLLERCTSTLSKHPILARSNDIALSSGGEGYFNILGLLLMSHGAMKSQAKFLDVFKCVISANPWSLLWFVVDGGMRNMSIISTNEWLGPKLLLWIAKKLPFILDSAAGESIKQPPHFDMYSNNGFLQDGGEKIRRFYEVYPQGIQQHGSQQIWQSCSVLHAVIKSMRMPDPIRMQLVKWMVQSYPELLTERDQAELTPLGWACRVYAGVGDPSSMIAICEYLASQDASALLPLDKSLDYIVCNGHLWSSQNLTVKMFRVAYNELHEPIRHLDPKRASHRLFGIGADKLISEESKLTRFMCEIHQASLRNSIPKRFEEACTVYSEWSKSRVMQKIHPELAKLKQRAEGQAVHDDTA